MTLLSGQDICVSLADRRVLEYVDIKLHEGELLGLIGPNGAGKSTLLRVLADLIEPEQGTLFYKDNPYAVENHSLRTQKISWLSQQREVHWPLTVRTLVGLGRTPHRLLGLPEDNEKILIDQIICKMDLNHLTDRPFDELSGGEQARTLLARALVGKPDVLLADEPVAGLDLAHQINVMQLLKSHCSFGHGAIVVLHDLQLASHFCDRLVLISDRRVITEGHADQVINNRFLRETYGVELNGSIQNDPHKIPWDLI